MVLIVVCLFNSLRVTAIIWFTVPLSLFGIVLIDEINIQLKSGKIPWVAVVDASVSRVRPVLMAVLTTVVGLLFASVLTLIVVPVLFVTLFRFREA